MKTIKIDLGSVSSMEAAIKELEEYQDELMDKIQQFLDALVQEGIQVASAKLGSTQGDWEDAYVDGIYVTDNKAIIILGGTDCLFVEFGAGIAYNTGMQHPKADEFGYGPGTYPGQTHVPIPGWWVYGKNEDKTPKISIGTEASMPLFTGAEHMRSIVGAKAREIFRS